MRKCASGRGESDGLQFVLVSSCDVLLLFISSIPQRLHRTCVLLWRLPKLLVPLAVKHSVSLQVLLQYRGISAFCVLIVSVLGEGHWSGPSKSSSLVRKSSIPRRSRLATDFESGAVRQPWQIWPPQVDKIFRPLALLDIRHSTYIGRTLVYRVFSSTTDFAKQDICLKLLDMTLNFKDSAHLQRRDQDAHSPTLSWSVSLSAPIDYLSGPEF